MICMLSTNSVARERSCAYGNTGGEEMWKEMVRENIMTGAM